MVDHPSKYRWSSFAGNALGVSNAILTAHDEYVALGCLSAYRSLFDGETDADELALYRDALQTGTPLGNDKFREQIESVLKRKVGYSRRGRPIKPNPQ